MHSSRVWHRWNPTVPPDLEGFTTAGVPLQNPLMSSSELTGTVLMQRMPALSRALCIWSFSVRSAVVDGSFPGRPSLLDSMSANGTPYSDPAMTQATSHPESMSATSSIPDLRMISADPPIFDSEDRLISPIRLVSSSGIGGYTTTGSSPIFLQSSMRNVPLELHSQMTALRPIIIVNAIEG